MQNSISQIIFANDAESKLLLFSFLVGFCDFSDLFRSVSDMGSTQQHHACHGHHGACKGHPSEPRLFHDMHLP